MDTWVGYDDIVKEGEWVWSDGGSTNNATTAWQPYRPDNSGGGEDCGHIREVSSDGRLLLNDLPCGYALHYVCEV